MGKRYTNILIALELTGGFDEEILHKVSDMTKSYQGHLHLVHIIEPVHTPPPFLDVAENYEADVRKKMTELGTKFEIPKENQFVKVANIEDEIFDLIKLIKADLLVVGNHGRHGIQSLFKRNHTASLMRNAECDILAIKAAM
ncbi:MAG: universal stress protein [Oligoflexales bacterium]